MSATAVPVAPGNLPLVGHIGRLWRRPIVFLETLRLSGDVVRVNIGTWPVYVVTTPQLVNEVLVSHAHDFGRGRVFEKLRPLFGDGLITSDGDFHLSQRRLVQPAFHREKIASLSTLMFAQAEALATSWSPGENVTVNETMRKLALDVIAKAVFSGELGRTAIDEIHRSLPIIMQGMLGRAVTPKIFDRVPLPANRRFDTAARGLKQVIDEIVAQYRSGPNGNDLLSLLLSSAADGGGASMSDSQIRDEAIAVMFAGIETVGTILAWLFHELSQNPEVDELVYSEVREVIGDGEVRISDLGELTYTRALINETLRLHAALFFTRRTLKDVKLGGYDIPAKSEVAYSPHALHRDTDLFPDPHRFDPSRWLSADSSDARRRAFVPFGLGRHRCIGDNFAFVEMMISVASIVRRWQLKPIPGQVVHEAAAGLPYPRELTLTAIPRA
ncbi:cytochrome P450 [Streptomyces sp. NPDC058469]|uniref:cytochrome P450 n=1 Tax=Streptomyces sp. NPDC058469 TaxID=3346514 RepID=UPI00365B4823